MPELSARHQFLNTAAGGALAGTAQAKKPAEPDGRAGFSFH
jgi:hypothetical protein